MALTSRDGKRGGEWRSGSLGARRRWQGPLGRLRPNHGLLGGHRGGDSSGRRRLGRARSVDSSVHSIWEARGVAVRHLNCYL